MMKLLLENWKRYLLKEQEPLALAVLGAPAGGKSYTMDKISSVVSDPRITKTIASGVVLTVDKLREEFQSKSPNKTSSLVTETFNSGISFANFSDQSFAISVNHLA